MEDNLQPTLFEDLQPITAPEYEEGATLKQRFWQFHCANPHIYRELRQMALVLHAKGVKKVGIALLYEQLRWRWLLQTKSDDFKLNNSYRSFYARLIIKTTPVLEGFFELRNMPSQEEPLWEFPGYENPAQVITE